MADTVDDEGATAASRRGDRDGGGRGRPPAPAPAPAMSATAPLRRAAHELAAAGREVQLAASRAATGNVGREGAAAGNGDAPAPETCAVCLNTLCMPAATTPCGHVFHANCIAQSMEYGLYVGGGRAECLSEFMWGLSRVGGLSGAVRAAPFFLKRASRGSRDLSTGRLDCPTSSSDGVCLT